MKFADLGLMSDEQREAMFARWNQEDAIRDLIYEGIEAFRLTREYLGEETLPALPGWSWFDWVRKAEEHLYGDESSSPTPA